MLLEEERPWQPLWERFAPKRGPQTLAEACALRSLCPVGPWNCHAACPMYQASQQQPLAWRQEAPAMAVISSESSRYGAQRWAEQWDAALTQGWVWISGKWRANSYFSLRWALWARAFFYPTTVWRMQVGATQWPTDPTLIRVWDDGIDLWEWRQPKPPEQRGIVVSSSPPPEPYGLVPVFWWDTSDTHWWWKRSQGTLWSIVAEGDIQHAGWPVYRIQDFLRAERMPWRGFSGQRPVLQWLLQEDPTLTIPEEGSHVVS